MIKEFIDAWNANKEELRKYFSETEQSEYCKYQIILQRILEKVINPYLKENETDILNSFSIKDIKVIDYGDYQGTLIIIFHEDTFQPDSSETYYTIVEYGSCSGCDTLLGIIDYGNGLPNEKQVNDYMTLALHLIQRTKRFEENDEYFNY